MKNFSTVAGIQFRKFDIYNILTGALLPPLLLFFIFLYLRFSGTLNNANYITLLLSGKKKLLYYLGIGIIEELLFRGIVFGFIGKKIKNITISILLSATIFAIPHSINANAPIYIMLMFSFVFGILACGMRCFTKSIWMSSAFHWTWNYCVVSVFMKTNTIQSIYGWITVEIAALALLFYLLCKKKSETKFLSAQ